MFSKDKSKEQPPKAPPTEVTPPPARSAEPAPARPSKQQKPAAMPSIISEGLQVTGNLSCDGDIQIDGRVQGDIEARSLTVGENGVVDGSIVADEVHVSGTLDGEISARSVVIARGAHVRGDIAHDVLSIESGAQFEGKSARRAGMPVETAAPAPVATAAPQPANKPLLSEVSGTGTKAASAS